MHPDPGTIRSGRIDILENRKVIAVVLMARQDRRCHTKFGQPLQRRLQQTQLDEQRFPNSTRHERTPG